jgi:RNA recognition motif-containing protein
MPPPSAVPRLVKHLPPGFTDSQLYDLFRPYGALASARTQAGFGNDTGVVEFWREEDAVEAESAMHCADVEGQSIAVQVYQPRRASTEFSVNAPAFVPSGSVFPYPTQVSGFFLLVWFLVSLRFGSTHLHARARIHPVRLFRSSTAQGSKSSSHHSPVPGQIATAASSTHAICSAK